MQKRTLVFFMFITCFTSSIFAVTIHSTAGGGYWGHTTTWVGDETIPSATDDVVLNGPVNSSNHACNDLTIMPSASLTNHTYENKTHYVNGDLINNGAISNGSANYLTLRVSGNVENNGTWDNRKVYFIGTTDQYVSMTNECAATFIYNNNTSGDIIATTNLTFNGSTIDFDSHTLELSGSGDVWFINSTYVDEMTILANGNTINMDASCYIQYTDITNSVFNGTIRFADNVDLYGYAINNGIMQNSYYYASNRIVNIYGDFTNNGTVRNSPSGNELRLYVTEDIVNNGAWNNEYLYFSGTSDQNLSLNTECNIKFVNSENTSGSIIALTDLTFNYSDLDFNDNILELSGSNDLFLTNDSDADEMTILANGNTINLDASSVIQYTDITNGVLAGTVRFGNSVDFYGYAINNGIMQNSYYASINRTVNIYGDFTNNGTVRNSPSGMNLLLYITEDIVNNGAWTNGMTSLIGTTDQTILLEDGNYLTGDVRFVSDVTGSAYQWKFESLPLDSPNFAGETTVELDWNVPVSGDYVGIYNCDVAGRTLSRNIIVTEPAPLVFEMSLISDSSIDHGTVYYGLDDTQEVIIQNDGNVDLSVSDVSFAGGSSSTFSYTYGNLGGAIAPGATNSIFVTFEPDVEDSFVGTLEITNNSTNNPLIEVPLSGIGEYDEIPAPENVTIDLAAGDATISWDAVIETVHGIPVTPDFYVVNYSEVPVPNPEDYYHLTATTELSVVHNRVVQFAPQMFYQVIAIRDYEGQYGRNIMSIKQNQTKITWREFKQKFLK
jgi:hypothetical protein